MTEAELLFTEVLGCDRAQLYFNRDRGLTLSQAHFISSALKRRACGEPIQYILGKTEFMGLEFLVNDSVLIPRQDTEILVEAALKYSRMIGNEDNILELGTGSGCVAISLAKFIPDLKVTATDISAQALATARKNAELNRVAERITFLSSDLFSCLREGKDKYSLCVSNPPYIASSEINGLQPEIKYEPRPALDGGRDGLDFYRRIINGSLRFLRRGGFLVMEMGYGQRSGIEEIFLDQGSFTVIEAIKDYNNLERVIVARRG